MRHKDLLMVSLLCTKNSTKVSLSNNLVKYLLSSNELVKT